MTPTLYLSIVHQGLTAVRDHHVLIAINVMQPKTPPVGLEVTLSDPASWTIAQQWIIDKQNAGWNVYFHANPVRTGLSKKAKKSDMLPCDMLQGDVDPTAGVPYEQGRQGAWSTVQSLCNSPTPPTLIFDSGNGYYPLVRLDRPLSVEEYDHANKAWNAKSGIVGTFNADRLLKVPGTIAFNDAKKQARGYPETSQAGIVALGGPILPTDTLLATVASYAPPDRAVRSKATETNDAEFSAAEMTDSLGIRIATLRAKHPAFNAAMGVAPDRGDRSTMLLNIARFLSGAGFTTHEYVAAVEDVSKSAMDHVEDQPYPRRTLRRAWDAVRPRPEDMPDISTLTLPDGITSCELPPPSGPTAWNDVPDFPDSGHGGCGMPEGVPWWQDVEPADVMQPLLAPSLPEHCIPPILRPLLAHHAPSMGVPPEIIFAACMGACMAALPDDLKIQPHDTVESWVERACLWLAVIGEASVKKTPGIKLGTKHLRKLDRQNSHADSEAIAEYTTELKRYRAMLKKYEDGKEGAVKPTMPPPEHPTTRRMIINDTTTAKLSDIMQHNPRGICMIRDELSGWLSTLENKGDGQKERADYLQLYDGGGYSMDRVSRGSVYVPNWSASIIGGIQPSKLASMLKDAPVDGLLQRFYPIIARSADRATNAHVDPKYMSDFDSMVHMLSKTRHGTVKLSPEASEILDRTWGDIHKLVKGGALSDAMTSHIAKWEGGLYRWAVVIHAMECAAYKCEVGTHIVSPGSAQIVADLHMKYFLPNLFVLYDDILSKTGDAEHVRWIAGHILANYGYRNKPLELRDLSRNYRAWGKTDDAQKRRVLRILEDYGWLEPLQQEVFLPKTYEVNPKVYSTFQQQAVEEQKRRAEIVRKIREQ